MPQATIRDYPLTESQWLVAYKVQHAKSPAALKCLALVRQKLRSQAGLVADYPLHHLPVSFFRTLFSLRSQGKPTLGDRIGLTRLLLNWLYGLNIPRGTTFVELQDVMVAICVGAVLVEVRVS